MAKKIADSRTSVLFERFGRKLLRSYMTLRSGWISAELYPATLDWAGEHRWIERTGSGFSYCTVG